MALPTDAAAVAQGLLEGRLTDRSEWKLADALVRIEQRQPDADAAALTRSVQTLLDQRLFGLAARAGAIAVGRFGADAGLRRRWVQALIDHGDLDQAEVQLKQSLALPLSAIDRAELIGLSGRLAKQRWVLARQADGSGGEDLLQQALTAYAEFYAQVPAKYWHGINTVALAKQAQQRGLPVALDWRLMAAAILKQRGNAFRKAEPDFGAFGLATAAEAALALGKDDDAELWAYRFVHSPAATPFALGSFARQLREIWQVPRAAQPRTPAERLLLAVESTLARLSGSVMLPVDTAAAAPQQAQYLEKVFGNERFIGFARWQSALLACEAVARIEQASGVGVGTGFVVRGSDLHASLGEQPVLLTNAHVISDQGVPGALSSADARVRFEVDARRDPRYVPLTISRVIWSSAPADLGDTRCPTAGFDVSLCTLEGPKLPARMQDLAPRLPLPSPQSRAYVIGHPDGDGLQLSLADSQLLAVCPHGKLAHYTTPTVGGSSGSPVFNADWKVFALHHAGSETAPTFDGTGTYKANEGISLHAIKAALARELGA